MLAPPLPLCNGFEPGAPRSRVQTFGALSSSGIAREIGVGTMAGKSILLAGLMLGLCTATAASAQAPAAPAAPASPQLEGKLRSVIADMQAGKPKLDEMEPALAQAVQQQQAVVNGIFGQLGALSSVAYLGPQNGGETYKVVFAHGSTNWLIAMAPSGKIGVLAFNMAQ
jgi:hypothetical protein